MSFLHVPTNATLTEAEAERLEVVGRLDEEGYCDPQLVASAQAGDEGALADLEANLAEEEWRKRADGRAEVLSKTAASLMMMSVANREREPETVFHEMLDSLAGAETRLVVGERVVLVDPKGIREGKITKVSPRFYSVEFGDEAGKSYPASFNRVLTVHEFGAIERALGLKEAIESIRNAATRRRRPEGEGEAVVEAVAEGERPKKTLKAAKAKAKAKAKKDDHSKLTPAGRRKSSKSSNSR